MDPSFLSSVGSSRDNSNWHRAFVSLVSLGIGICEVSGGSDVDTVVITFCLPGLTLPSGLCSCKLPHELYEIPESIDNRQVNY